MVAVAVLVDPGFVCDGRPILITELEVAVASERICAGEQHLQLLEKQNIVSSWQKQNNTVSVKQKQNNTTSITSV